MRLILCLITSGILAIACGRSTGYLNQEWVELRPGDDEHFVLATTDIARIRCPMADIERLALAPRPLTPHQWREYGSQPERLRERWLETVEHYRERLGDEMSYTEPKPKHLADFVHAGICEITDRTTGEPVAAILVTIEEGRIAGQRRFGFDQARIFLTTLDWIR